MLRPGSSRLSGGVHTHTVELMQGTRTPFREIEIDVLMPLDTRFLHVHDTHSRGALQLVPLVRMMNAPLSQETACYFYNRVDKKGTRWLSFHFDRESEQHTEAPDTDLQEVFEALVGQASASGEQSG